MSHAPPAERRRPRHYRQTVPRYRLAAYAPPIPVRGLAYLCIAVYDLYLPRRVSVSSTLKKNLLIVRR